MNIEGFYDLIRTKDSANAQIAWQIARGQKVAGDQHFSAFVKAIYSWTFSDLKGYGPIEFLMGLHQSKLHCKIFRKKQIPPQSYAIAPLVEEIEIEALETKVFPRGFENFGYAKSLKFGTWFLRELGDELAGIPSLKFLSFQSQYDFRIKAEFVACKNIERLHLRSYNAKVLLPDNLAEMEQLHEVGLFIGSRTNNVIWTCQQLKRLILSDTNSQAKPTASYEFWKNAVRLKNLEELTFLPNHSNYLESVVLPNFIYDIKQLKHLKFFATRKTICRFNHRITEMEHLEALSITKIHNSDLKILSKHPKLKNLYVEEYSCPYQEDLQILRNALPNITVELIKNKTWGLLR